MYVTVSSTFFSHDELKFQLLKYFQSPCISQVKSTLFRQGSPISYWLVSKGAPRKLRLHDKILKIKNYVKIMYNDFQKRTKGTLLRTLKERCKIITLKGKQSMFL